MIEKWEVLGNQITDTPGYLEILGYHQVASRSGVRIVQQPTENRRTPVGEGALRILPPKHTARPGRVATQLFET
jgi:hypothetical protein